MYCAAAGCGPSVSPVAYMPPASASARNASPASALLARSRVRRRGEAAPRAVPHGNCPPGARCALVHGAKPLSVVHVALLIADIVYPLFEVMRDVDAETPRRGCNCRRDTVAKSGPLSDAAAGL